MGSLAFPKMSEAATRATGVGDVGQAALDHWLRETARTRGEEHLIALQIAQEIAQMAGIPWDEVFSEEAA